MKVESYPEELIREIGELFQQWEKSRSDVFLAMIHVIHLLSRSLCRECSYPEDTWRVELGDIAAIMLEHPGAISPEVYLLSTKHLHAVVSKLSGLSELGALDIQRPTAGDTQSGHSLQLP